MGLKEKLLLDLKDAMKEKDTLRKDVIQIVRAGVLQVEKDHKIEIDDSGVIDIIAKELKKRHDVMPDYERSGRQDLIDDVKRQIQLLKGYLPEQLSQEELAKIVSDAVNESGSASIKDMGKVMAAIAPKVKGRADNKTVSELVKEKLNELSK